MKKKGGIRIDANFIFQIKKLEPNVVAYSALYSPNTGITDYGLVAQCIANEIMQTG